jgi:hypothetical protein
LEGVAVAALGLTFGATFGIGLTAGFAFPTGFAAALPATGLDEALRIVLAGALATASSRRRQAFSPPSSAVARSLPWTCSFALLVQVYTCLASRRPAFRPVFEARGL